jgi:hypothetical protein
MEPIEVELGQNVVLCEGEATRLAAVTHVYDDEKGHVDVRYHDAAYVDAVAEGEAPGEPRADHVNVSAVPHVSHVEPGARCWHGAPLAAVAPTGACGGA